MRQPKLFRKESKAQRQLQAEKKKVKKAEEKKAKTAAAKVLSSDASALSLEQLVNASSQNEKRREQHLTSLVPDVDNEELQDIVNPKSFEGKKELRKKGFKDVKKDLKYWEPIVEENKTAKLSFPLDKEALPYNPTSKELMKRAAQNPTTLEQQVYNTLRGSKLPEAPDNLTGLNEQAMEMLDKLHYNEALERLKEMRRRRILTSWQLARLTREKKIKSKSFRRIKTQYKLEKFEEKIKEKGLDKIMEERRIKERAELRHSKSKWDRQLMRYAKHEARTRNALESKRQIGKKLKSKVADDSDIEDEDEDDEEEEEEWEVVDQRKGFVSKYAPSGEACTHFGPVSKNADSSSDESEIEIDQPEDDEPASEFNFRKEFQQKEATTLNIGDPFARKPRPVLDINTANFLSRANAVETVTDKPLATSVDSAMVQEAFEDDDEDLMEELQTEEKSDDKPIKVGTGIGYHQGWGNKWLTPANFDTCQDASSKKEEAAGKLPRRPPQMGYVVINEGKNKGLSKHQVHNPLPEHKAKQMKKSVGFDFVTPSSFASMTEPRIKKKVGVAFDAVEREKEETEKMEIKT